MTKANPKAKTGKLRGPKLLLAGFSIAATLTGWVWLTNQETALGENTGDNSVRTETSDTNRALPQSRNLSGTFRVQGGASRIPNLSTLPVRGILTAPNSALNDGNGNALQPAPLSGTTLSPQFNTRSQQSVPQMSIRRRTRSSR